jgi:exodeoxyribonuclease VII large subunit
VNRDLFSDLPPASAVEKVRARPNAYSVSELAELLRITAESVVGQVWVKGEITGLKTYQSGHWYFSIRDAGGQLRCVMWRFYAQKLKAVPPEGTEVYILGTPTVWEERGELRLTVVTVLPTAGVGLQQVALERTRAVLERDGLLDPDRKRPLPSFPKCIALVTSPDGAALHDLISVARRRWPCVRLILVGSMVQGDGAEEELVLGLQRVNQLEEIDLCIVARGGGAREDLGAFNAEAVCRAVAAVRVPTISAVGHETDVSLADLVADLRAPTPSAAMAMALPDRSTVARQVADLGTRLGHGLTRRTRVLTERLEHTGDRLRSGVLDLVRERHRTFERLAAELSALSPLNVLARGYSVAQRSDGRVARRRADLPPGSPFSLRLSDGTLDARVENQ